MITEQEIDELALGDKLYCGFYKIALTEEQMTYLIAIIMLACFYALLSAYYRF